MIQALSKLLYIACAEVAGSSKLYTDELITVGLHSPEY